MKNYLCWEPGAVRQVINPFAEHISDGLFRAVHSDWDLKVSPQVGKRFQDIGDANWTDLTPAAFLNDFLLENRPHALAAILGTTGSGKSHLVHWMRLNIKPDSSRLVLVVRKSGTSLRAIVKMIIAELPEDQQGSFLETLQSAGDGTQSRDDQKQQLLNDLAQVIREDKLAPDADEVEQALVGCLPDLFQDPHMRKAHFLGDNTVIAEIVDHIFAPSNAQDRPDQRRSFSESDLPLGGMDFAHASKLAQDAIQIIELDPPTYLPLAIKIINRNLDRAVARTLSFSGDRVEELMTRLRTYLKTQGKELVLLVEEFARLQGIDRALLQAITSQGDERQCKMRTAIAVTTGFFQSVAETAYMRTTHIVDMDRSAGRADGDTVTQASLSQFTSRYLNAVRLGRDGIGKWNAGAKAGESPPSRCDTCPHQAECHPIFGAVEGYGLYPFTSQALWNAALRADHSMPESLNPRILQNDLLVEVLDNFGPSIATGTFAHAQTASMKGGRAGPMLNPGKIIGPVRDLRQAKWRPRLIPPDDDRNEPAKTYRDVKATLAAAADAEMAVRQAWLKAMEEAFGEGATRASILSTLDTARAVVADAGIGTNNTSKPLSDALERLRLVQFDESLNAARTLAKQEDGVSALPYYGRGRKNAVEAGSALAAATHVFLDAVDQNLGANSQSVDARHAALADSLQRIDASLLAIENELLEMMAPNGVHANVA